MAGEAVAASKVPAILASMLAQAESCLELLGPALRHLETADDVVPLVELLDRIQTVYRKVRDLESGALLVAGRRVKALGWDSREGELPDGRPFVLRRTADRKAWDHDRWKHDVRQVLVDMYQPRPEGSAAPSAMVNADTGEEFDLARLLQEVIQAAQIVHGATAPKSTTLKALGLDPGDYCETVRGNWTLDLLPATNATTTTEETPTHD